MRPDIVPGAIFPGYELSDHSANRRKLSELQGQHPMVLVLSRGSFCPKDRRQAEGLVQLHRELEVAFYRLVTISTDNITETNENRSGVGAHWFFGRPTVEALRQDLRAVTSKCRPDWDITTPELKAAWQQRRKELFFPYGKPYVQTLGEQD